jgi:alpha-galactosidase
MSASSPVSPVSIKIAYIGGGSRYWAKMVLTDLALEPALTGEIALYDLDFDAAVQNEVFGRELAAHPDARHPFTVRACRDVADALRGADFVFMSILPGRMQLMAHDLDIPSEFGIHQTVGDTTGPGGISRALRTIPIYTAYAQLLMEHCPRAWVINYTNPMTLCTAALYAAAPGIKAIGCCHEVFGTQKKMAGIIARLWNEPEPKRDEIKLDISGVNHFTFATRATWRGRDLFPLLDQYLKTEYDWSDQTPWSVGQRDEGKFFGSRAMIAWDFYRRFGAIGAAGDRHLVEFVPWYVSSIENLHRHGVVQTPSSFRLGTWQPPGNRPAATTVAADTRPFLERPLQHSGEEGVAQLLALVGGPPLDTNVNLPNTGQMPQFAHGIVVETNAQIRHNSITPVIAAPLPDAVRSLVQRVVDVQTLTLQASLRGDPHLALQALALDPLCGHLPLARLEELLHRLLTANREALPAAFHLYASTPR